MFLYKEKEVIEFIKESNAIANEWSDIAVETSLKAWDFLAGFTDKLDLKDLLVTHEIMLEMINPSIAGKLRSELMVDVQVGGRICPRYQIVPSMINDWIWEINNTVWTKQAIKQLHIDFEKIHPFQDGNGRVGRLILLWMRQSIDMPFELIEYIKRYEYYAWFYNK